MLHITNGDIAADLIRSSGIPGDVLPWRDVLHEGPVRSGLRLDAQSKERADCICSLGWGAPGEVHRQFEERDQRFIRSTADEEVVLWFEHDLHDQLELIQILHLYSGEVAVPGKLSLICIDRHEGHPRFIGLGQLSPEEIAALFPSREAVSNEMLRDAESAWTAFTSPAEGVLKTFADRRITTLPFLAAALRRFVKEYPESTNGLARTESQALRSVLEEPLTAFEMFHASQLVEPAPYLGDLGFFEVIKRLQSAAVPGLFAADEHFDITDFGKRVLAGQENWIERNGINRWFGGYFQSSPGTGPIVDC